MSVHESEKLSATTTLGEKRNSSENDVEKVAQRDSDLESGEDVEVTVPELTKRPVLKYDPIPWYLRVPFMGGEKPPPPASLSDAKQIPDATASILSIFTFQWITPMLLLGYSRPLEATDLWKIDDKRAATVFANKTLNSFQRRYEKAETYNRKLESGEIKLPLLKAVWWTIRGVRKEREKKWREKDGKKLPSLVWAINDSIAFFFWSGGAFKVAGDTLQVCSPLVVKAIINYSTEAYDNRKLSPIGSYDYLTPVGKGIGLAFALLAMQLSASVCTHQFFYRSMASGVFIRGGLITAVYARSLRLTSRARSSLPNGKLVNHISTDISRIDFCAGYFHFAWAAPIQLTICLILLITNIGPSALAGFALFVFLTPAQTWAMKKLFGMRRKSMVWTDKRAKLLQELLGGIRVIKYFAWESPFLKRIGEYRDREIVFIRSLLITRAGNNSLAQTLPTLAAILSFVTFSLSGHTLRAAEVFTALTLFQLLRLPLMFLPMSLSAIADARNALGRLREVFLAEVLTQTKQIDPSLDVAIRVEHASFTWDGVPPDEAPKGKKGHGHGPGHGRGGRAKGKQALVVEEKAVEEERIFQLKDIDFDIPRGQLCAVVGPVGSGKSSLLQGLIGEMRRTEGSVTFGGSVGYCPQSAWIQGATVRENITFGRPFEEEKYWSAVRDSCLEPDLAILPSGDLTEVGERGISLSGGQKQRISIARCLYARTEVTCLDDPFSALDAHVGKAVFQNVIQTAMAGQTRVLVTHALHFLPYTDYIISMDNGRIGERGTYQELMAKKGQFAKFVAEFGSKEDEEEKEKDEEALEDGGGKSGPEKKGKRKPGVPGVAMMQEEERNTGAVRNKVYGDYFKAAHGNILLPILFLSVAFMQVSNVLNSYWLVFWEEKKWPLPEGFYMGVYAALGVSQALGSFGMGGSFALLSFYASVSLHRACARRVLHAPMSFFDTTPLGRIMNRFSKDIDTIDNLLADSGRMLTGTLSSIIGAIILITIILPWFIIGGTLICTLYYWAALFYRSSARELKRLDAILRSSLYSHFSESLSGLATIRAYGEADRFRSENEHRMDIENRAYYLTVVNQRWLGIRLDLLGSLLTFSVAVLTVAARYSISPSQTGVTLSFIVLVQQAFGFLVRQSAEVENNMNGVERILHYANSIEQEPPHEIPEKKPPPPWPSSGHLVLKDVVMSYRPGLPSVLKGVSLDIRPGEHIGIVGRTGAGKSSIMVALYRLVELTSGSITLDGVDVSQIGLDDLRKSLAIIPQDPLLFSGTLRTNLDPFGVYDDARLWDALRRASLVDQVKEIMPTSGDDSGTHTPVNRFTLDTPIEDEGGNLSVGQRSLVSLARALVKDSPIVLLDEATASVDYETDRNIQDTIASEFGSRTLLCIAHRLRTIIGYDRICVMDAGLVAELDTPANLYAKPDSIFRSMCDRSGITLDDIQYAVKGRHQD